MLAKQASAANVIIDYIPLVRAEEVRADGCVSSRGVLMRKLARPCSHLPLQQLIRAAAVPHRPDRPFDCHLCLKGSPSAAAGSFGHALIPPPVLL